MHIGEDSGNHLNNFTWAFNGDSNGHAYLTGNVQHPGAEEDLSKYPPQIKVDLRKLVDERGIVGYFGGLPAMTR